MISLIDLSDPPTLVYDPPEYPSAIGELYAKLGRLQADFDNFKSERERWSGQKKNDIIKRAGKAIETLTEDNWHTEASIMRELVDLLTRQA